MQKSIDTQLIGLRCGHCGQQKAVLLGWLKEHDQLECDCGNAIVVRANDLVDAVKRADALSRRVPTGSSRDQAFV